MGDAGEEEENLEDGEIIDGFLGQAEMESRKTLTAAYGGEDSKVSWVEAVLLGAKHVTPADAAKAEVEGIEGGDGDGDAGTEKHQSSGEPPPPGTAADRPPPSAAATARLEAALVHKVTALLGAGGDDSEGRHDDAATLVEILAEATADGIDVARWLGHGRTSIRGRTPLMEAARRDRTRCCAVLAEAACAQGAGLNAGNEAEGRNSSLHYACYEGAGGSVCELLVRGADPRLRNGEGETALQAALANGQAECADLVRDFLRRPTFEPDPQSDGSGVSVPTFPSNPPPTNTTTTINKGGFLMTAVENGGSGGIGDAGGACNSGGVGSGSGGGSGIGGVTGVAPEVCRANAVFCLGRRRRRLGSRVRPGRGLGVGVGTAAAEVGLGARRCARLHATNPCAGTAMEAFVLWSIARGEDPFRSEGVERCCGEIEGDRPQLQRRRRGGEGSSGSVGTAAGGGREAAVVWLGYYVHAYNESLHRLYGEQKQSRSANRQQQQQQQQHRQQRASEPKQPEQPEQRRIAVVAPYKGAGCNGGGGGGSAAAVKGSVYTLVVKQSKALAEGRRFELRCGDNLVIGRSQSLAGIVVKDEMVSKAHLRIVNSEYAGVRLNDLGSKHGAVITKPAPPFSTTATAAAAAAVLAAGGGDNNNNNNNTNSNSNNNNSSSSNSNSNSNSNSTSSSSSGAPAVPTPAPAPAPARRQRPAGLGGKDPPLPPTTTKRTFFPIPVPREPEWVAGAHGDRISLGKTIFLLERKGGPEPPDEARRRCRHKPGGIGGGLPPGAAGSGARPAAVAGAEGRSIGPAALPPPPPPLLLRGSKTQSPAVISKGFAANPNLMDAIRTAEERERGRKRMAAASEYAATAATQYLSNKRTRPATAVATASSAARLPPTAAAVVGVAVNQTGAAAAVGAGLGQDEDREQSFHHVSKGSMLLRRMGWKEGQGLGRRSDGQLQPVQVKRRGERAGLGTAQGGGNSSSFAVGPDGRVSKWEHMRRRFSEAQSSSGPSLGFRELVRRARGGADGVRWLKGEAQQGGGDGS